MLDLIATIVFATMAYRIAVTVRRESAILREFGQAKSLAFLALLFPLGPFIYLVSVYRLGWIIAVVAAAACYVPSLIVAKRQLHVFDRAGTDRVRAAQSAATQALGTAIGGLVYTGVLLAFTLFRVMREAAVA